MSIHRTRRAVPVLTMAVLALLVAACATPTPIAVSTAAGLSRETPEATYEYFKTMARNNQWANEWAVFSPNFKRMINQEAGRNVDVGDYSTARQTIATNNQADMQMLLNRRWRGPRSTWARTGRGSRSRPADGRVSPTMVRMTKWEMQDPRRGLARRGRGLEPRRGDHGEHRRVDHGPRADRPRRSGGTAHDPAGPDRRLRPQVRVVRR